MLQIDMSPTLPFSAKPALKAYLPMFHFRKCYRRYLAKRTEILPQKNSKHRDSEVQRVNKNKEKKR